MGMDNFGRDLGCLLNSMLGFIAILGVTVVVLVALIIAGLLLGGKTMLWECKECGCQGIVGDLDFCPQCFRPRPAEPAGTPAETEQPEPTPAFVSASDWGR